MPSDNPRGYRELAYNPIQWAVINKNKETVGHLISEGASLDVKTKGDELLLELAKKEAIRKPSS